MNLRNFSEHIPILRRFSRTSVSYFDLQEILITLFGLDLDDKENKEFSVALVTRDGLTYPKSSAFIRLISPLTDLSLKARVSLQIYSENTKDIGKANVCIVQRTAYDDENVARSLTKNLEAKKCRLIIDTDDAFDSIDPSHPEYEAQKSRVAALNYLLGHAEQVWVSVPKLAEAYSTLKAKVTVIPNSLDKRLWLNENPSAQASSGPIEIVYMGTATHDADLDMILPALDEVHKLHPDSFELTTIGVASSVPERPWLTRLVQPHGIAIYPNFVKWFLDQGPFDLGLSPLVDSEFNHGKSDIKCLDYLAAGIMPIVSDVTPYKNKELDDFIIRVSNSHEDWVNRFVSIVKNPDEFRQNKAKLIPKAQDYIWSKRSSSQTAQKILELLSSS